MLEKLPLKVDLETKEVLKQLSKTSRALAELKGIANTMPNQNILINAIMINEAKSSSSIENIVTTHDEIYKAMVKKADSSPAAKEVVDYRSAIWVGYALIKEYGFLNTNIIIKIQEKLEHNNAGIRSVPGTVIKNNLTNEIVYTPPQSKEEVIEYMHNLENYINENNGIDPLIKLAIIHYQFESIHPFYDGNGRTGRIINILYLVLKELLDTPILYLSKYIIKNKKEYYELFQTTRKTNNFEDWIIYILKGIEETSRQTITIIKKISEEMLKMKQELRTKTKIYSKELLEALFYEFYTKIPYIEKTLKVSSKTAQKYLDYLVELGFLSSEKIGRERIYKNERLFQIIKKLLNKNTGTFFWYYKNTGRKLKKSSGIFLTHSGSAKF